MRLLSQAAPIPHGPCRMTILHKLSSLLLRLGLLLHVRAFRQELNRRLDNGAVELWGTAMGLDEEGCVCSEAACFFRRYHQDFT